MTSAWKGLLFLSVPAPPPPQDEAEAIHSWQRHFPVAEEQASDVELGVLTPGSHVHFGILNWEQGFLFQ